MTTSVKPLLQHVDRLWTASVKCHPHVGPHILATAAIMQSMKWSSLSEQGIYSAHCRSWDPIWTEARTRNKEYSHCSNLEWSHALCISKESWNLPSNDRRLYLACIFNCKQQGLLLWYCKHWFNFVIWAPQVGRETATCQYMGTLSLQTYHIRAFVQDIQQLFTRHLADCRNKSACLHGMRTA